MAYFKDTDHLYECIGGLFDVMKKDPLMGPKLRASGLIIRFNYRDPDATITGNMKEDPEEEGLFFQWFPGPNDLKPDVDMSMKADIAHRFWLGKVNLLQALTRKQIIAKGPIPKILKLLPAIKPSYGIYKKLLKQKGYENMLK
jgi:hypothetical protein